MSVFISVFVAPTANLVSEVLEHTARPKALKSCTLVATQVPGGDGTPVVGRLPSRGDPALPPKHFGEVQWHLLRRMLSVTESCTGHKRESHFALAMKQPRVPRKPRLCNGFGRAT